MTLASARERWLAAVKGENVGPMVSPLCDDWALDIPYTWPFEEPDPFPPGHPTHSLSQQMAMAGFCGWDPTFLAGVAFPPQNSAVNGETTSRAVGDVTRHEYRVQTPYGDLTNVWESSVSNHTIKALLADEADYRRMAWLTQQQMDYDEATPIAEGKVLRHAIGDRGVLGVWFSPPIDGSVNGDEKFYHLADYPDAVSELWQAQKALAFKKLETYRAAGYDYLFYCVSGTEWGSPDYFQQYVLEDTREILRRWRALGGFILWHSCGLIKTFVERGFYNDPGLRPEIFETMSEPPVGDLPSLKWARERLDPSIITKGNMPLNILLNGTPEDVRADVRRIKSETAGCRHVVGLSDDVLRSTPLANCRAFVEEGKAGG